MLFNEHVNAWVARSSDPSIGNCLQGWTSESGAQDFGGLKFMLFVVIIQLREFKFNFNIFVFVTFP